MGNRHFNDKSGVGEDEKDELEVPTQVGEEDESGEEGEGDRGIHKGRDGSPGKGEVEDREDEWGKEGSSGLDKGKEGEEGVEGENGEEDGEGEKGLKHPRSMSKDGEDEKRDGLEGEEGKEREEGEGEEELSHRRSSGKGGKGEEKIGLEGEGGKEREEGEGEEKLSRHRSTSKGGKDEERKGSEGEESEGEAELGHIRSTDEGGKDEEKIGLEGEGVKEREEGEGEEKLRRHRSTSKGNKDEERDGLEGEESEGEGEAELGHIRSTDKSGKDEENLEGEGVKEREEGEGEEELRRHRSTSKGGKSEERSGSESEEGEEWGEGEGEEGLKHRRSKDKGGKDEERGGLEDEKGEEWEAEDLDGAVGTERDISAMEELEIINEELDLMLEGDETSKVEEKPTIPKIEVKETKTEPIKERVKEKVKERVEENVEEKEEEIAVIYEPGIEITADLVGRIIKGHKPPVVVEHSPSMVCCLSLKTWAVWLLEIIHNAHSWTKWVHGIIMKVKEFAAVVRGEVILPNRQKKVLYKEDWVKFAKEIDEMIVAWRQYSVHVKDLSANIIENFHGKRVNCCPKCLQDHEIKNIVTAHETLKALTEAMNCAGYWQRCLDKIVDKTTALADLESTESNETSEDRTSRSVPDELEELPGESDGSSFYEIEEFELSTHTLNSTSKQKTCGFKGRPKTCAGPRFCRPPKAPGSWGPPACRVRPSDLSTETRKRCGPRR